MGRKSQEPLTLVAGSAPTLADPPATLREAGASLWRSIIAEYAITDSGGRAILEQACASADRAAECAAIIAEQGAVISTKHGLKDHPLLRHALSHLFQHRAFAPEASTAAPTLALPRRGCAKTRWIWECCPYDRLNWRKSYASWRAS